MKKIVVYFCSIVCLISSIVIYSSAWEPIAVFSYWHSNGNSIAYIPSNGKRTVYILDSTSTKMSEEKLLNYFSYAKGNWTSEGTFTRTTLSSNYGILFGDISRSEASSTFDIPSNVEAFTYQEYNFVGYASYKGSKRQVYTIKNGQIVALIYDSNTSKYSDSKWKAISTHEFGHVVGYLDHDSGATSSNKAIMYSYTDTYWDKWKISKPQTRDLQHLGNI